MSLTGNLESLKQRLDDAKAKMDALQKEWDTHNAYALEYYRQATVHKDSGYTAGQLWASGEYEKAVANRSAVESKLASAKKDYATALTDYNAAVANATPEQKEEILSQTRTDEMNANTENKLADAFTFAAKQKTTLYLIGGAIALVILGIVVMYYRKKFAA